MDLGVPELLFIFGIALLIWGPKKLGELGKGLGDGIRHFKSAVKDEPPAPAPAPPESTPVETSKL
jgi:sec-independent protein translocase protein TatA